MKLKVIQEFDGNKIDAVIERVKPEGDVLVKAKMVEEVVGSDELGAVEKAFADKIQQAVEAATKKTLETIRKSVKGVNIQMGDSEEDKLARTGGYPCEEAFYIDVKQAAHGRATQSWDKYLVATKAVHGMAIATPADGGYLVPVEYATTLNERSLALEIMRPGALDIPMGASSIKVNGLDDYDRTDAAKGGQLGTVTAEGGTSPAITKLAFEQLTLTPVKIMVDCSTTPELEEDSPQSVPALINRIVPARMSQKIDQYLLTGSGASQPLGAFHASNAARKLVAKAAGQTRATTPIVLQNVTDMFCAAKDPASCVWVTGQAMLSYLLQLGSTYFLPFSNGNNIVGPPPMTLFGRPLFLTGKLAAAGTVGDIGFVNRSQYMVGQRGGIRTASSIHVYWSTDEYCYRFVIRLDGKPGWSAVETLENSETISPFVTLAGD
jgi:HK97 family phage major capsid protein